MDDLATLMQKVRDGDVDAFSPVVERFQDMAVGYAWSVLKDYHLAEDAAQNAFVTAYLNLESIAEPAAFPGWIRRIVFTECTRITRRKSPELREEMPEVTDSRTPDLAVVAREKAELVNGLIAELPDLSREVVILYYQADLSQSEIADFLGVEEGTIKKRLHDARARMRKGIESMTRETLQSQRPSRDGRFAESVVAVITTAAEAIETGDANRLRALVEAHPDIVNVGGALDFRYGETSYFTGATMLHFLCGHPTSHHQLPDNVLELMEILLDAGADPNARTGDGGTMLSLICWHIPRVKGVLLDMIELLVSRGADPNVAEGRSVLENALWHSEVEAARLLLELGADYDLRLAAGLGRTDLVAQFFDADGSLTQDAYKLAPPVGEGHKRECSREEILVDAISLAINNWQFQAIDWLLEKDADINEAAPFAVIPGMTPLHMACCIPGKHREEWGEPEMVAFLLDRGADPTKKEAATNAPPIGWAIHNGHGRIVAYLLERVGPAEPLANHLRHAIQRYHEGDNRESQRYIEWIGSIRALLEYGADPIEDPDGHGPPLARADDLGEQDVVKMLKEAAG